VLSVTIRPAPRMGESFSTAPRKRNSGHGISIAFQLSLICTIVKVHGIISNTIMLTIEIN
jgi:hypothetical protein